MIDLYGMASPNVVKIGVMLEEIGKPYDFHHVDVMRGEGRTPEFLALNPIGKVPVIVDHDGAGTGQPIFESGAILIYLAETYGPSLLPSAGPARWEVLKWLVAQVAWAGPMLGQLNHFHLIPSEVDSYGATRYRDQAALVYQEFERRLNGAAWLGGDDFSIADIAMYPWSAYIERHGFDPARYPRMIAWRNRIDERATVRRAVGRILAAVEKNPRGNEPITDEAFDRFFGRARPGPAADTEAYLARGPFITARAL